MICLKISIFVVSNTTILNPASRMALLWFAWKFLSLWYQTQPQWAKNKTLWVVICLKISIFVVSNTTANRLQYTSNPLWFAWKFLSLWYQTQHKKQDGTEVPELWFAWKFLSLWYQTQLKALSNCLSLRCDLLENFYLCGIKHNYKIILLSVLVVVICLKISIFVVSNTTTLLTTPTRRGLWFAWKFLSLWYQTQPPDTKARAFTCCDLLENFYLCGIKHNNHRNTYHYHQVVICLKISIFVVSNTTLHCSFLLPYQLWFAWKFLSLWYQTQPEVRIPGRSLCCDLLENFYLCGIKHNIYQFHHSMTCVVICLKISIFVVSNTTITMPFGYRSSCDLLENFYLCGIKHN